MFCTKASVSIETEFYIIGTQRAVKMMLINRNKTHLYIYSQSRYIDNCEIHAR
ncbi:hypothetical protein BABINDRAFT_83932 [Babjeviella inositovora NRRL Y-12698]|uniref:Uncharacterized protein n=1 Tax=Babjeviella inositovora NRRL Y-12698 TaxID=984486 RepID=A0A1E3QL65_9ASCO|nr:uncharacterized protein BABINDRAFT_83932 [Babjeviella inositovora NRRL Y-12698]ODQ78425.1 hypothetical protein BABINDRAFT_83932 [Babjeviella inositovora NRRL Y-12698]